MLNIRGTDLLWPSPVRVVMTSNRNWRMEAGSKAEMVLVTFLVVASLALYPRERSGLPRRPSASARQLRDGAGQLYQEGWRQVVHPGA
jgi:hypothetical protein